MSSNGRNGSQDKLAESILVIISEASEPLETKEIEARVVEAKTKDVTRIKVMWRLQNLRGEGKIKGKFVGPGKGVWIWWKGDVYEKK